MKKTLIVLTVLAALLVPNQARAQIFSGGYNPFTRPEFADMMKAQKFGRFLVGTYFSQWDFSPQPIPGEQGFNTEFDPDASPLFTLDYFIRKDLSIGGWYNPVPGELFGITPNGSRKKLANDDLNFWDIHLTYYLKQKKDWSPAVSFQIGYGAIHQDVDVTFTDQVKNFGQSNFHTSIWTNVRQLVARPKIGKHRRPVHVLGEFGYYPAVWASDHVASEEHDLNLVFGAQIGINRHLSVGGSVWINGLDYNSNIRGTFGLLGTF